MWTFQQSTGKILQDGREFADAYSGHGEGVDNPADEAIQGIGPLPTGGYTIGAPFTHPHAGPLCMRLTPDPENAMFGRAGFMIHGDNAFQNQSASEGCIVVSRAAREVIAEAVAAGDNRLTVIE
jgi:hypothetical protein